MRTHGDRVRCPCCNFRHWDGCNGCPNCHYGFDPARQRTMSERALRMRYTGQPRAVDFDPRSAFQKAIDETFDVESEQL